MEVKLELGAVLDAATPHEVRQQMDASIARAIEVWRQRGIGVKWTEQALPVQPAAPSLLLPAVGGGFAWKIRVISVVLAAAGTLGAFKGANPGTRPLGPPAASVAFLFGGVTFNVASMFFPDDVVIQSGQQILIAATQNISNYYYGAVQFPAERQGEILG